MEIQPNQTLLHYRLLEKLGEGGMGVVWKAIDGKLAREVAIKILPAEVASDVERFARFEREAKLLASLNQRNIAAIYGIEHAPPETGEGQGVHFLVMELVEGEDLAQRLARGSLSVEDSVDVCIQIARALEVAHDNGVIHRDLKPANVMIDAEGRVKVLDFGLAKAFETESAADKRSPSLSPTITSAGTRTGMILGTAAYMSPEQARGRVVDKRSDLWSYGCVLFECLTGRQVFRGETITDTLASVLKVDPDWSLLPANTPPRIGELLERCLAKNLKQRMRDAGDARLELERIGSGVESISGIASGITTVVPEVAPRRSMASVPSLLAAAVVGGAIGIGLWSSFFGSDTSRMTVEAGQTTRLSFSYPKELQVRGARLSPDGRTMALRASPRKPETPEEDFARLYLRRLDQDKLRVVEGSDRVGAFSLSRDGNWLAMLTRPDPESSSSRLFKVPVDGSAPPLALLDWPDNFWTPLLWLPGGDLLARTEDREIVRIPTDGSPPGTPTKIQAAGFDSVFSFGVEPGHLLPDGIHVLGQFATYGEAGFGQSIGVLNIETGEARVLLANGNHPRWSPTGHLLFSRGETLLAVPFDPQAVATTGATVAVTDGLRVDASWDHGWFDVLNDGTLTHIAGGLVGGERQLIRFSAKLDELGPWSEDRRPFETFGLTISANGRRLAVIIPDSGGLYDTWISEVERPSLRMFAYEKEMDCTPHVWTPEGDRLVYACRDERIFRMFIRSADGSDEPKLLLENSPKTQYYAGNSITLDASTLVLTFSDGNDRSLMTLSLASASDDPVGPKLLLKDAADGMISPDGRWILYHSEATGRWETYLRRYGSDGTLGPEVRVSTEGGWDSWWYKPAEDAAQEIRFESTGGFYQVRLTTEPELRLSRPELVPEFQAAKELLRQFHDGAPLPNGEFIAIRESPDEADPTSVELVLNWTAELERRLK